MAPIPTTSQSCKRKLPSNLESEVHEETEFGFDRDEDFYKGDTSLIVGPVRVRLYFDINKYCWIVCFKKENNFNDSSAFGDSYFRFTAKQIPNVIKAIENCVAIIQDVAHRDDELTFPITDDKLYYHIEFWNRVFCEKIPSGELILRPFEDNKGCFYVRVLCPKSSQYKDWLGSSCSLGIDYSIQFCALLRRFGNFMMLSNIRRNEMFEAGIDPDMCGLARASPTNEDLMEASAHFGSASRMRANKAIPVSCFPSTSKADTTSNEIILEDPRLIKRVKSVPDVCYDYIFDPNEVKRELDEAESKTKHDDKNPTTEEKQN
jgi:hypothetical protein